MKKKMIIPIILVVAVAGLVIWQSSKSTSVVITPQNPTPSVPTQPNPEPTSPLPEIPTKPEPTEPTPTPEGDFSIVTLTTTKPGAELAGLIGRANVSAVLALNRIDDKNLWQGMTIAVPSNFEDPNLWEFMPETIDAASGIPKMALISQRTQAYGFYENGKLVKSGPVSTGKKSTQTPSRLYFANWKGKEVVSTFDDEWILKWNFNLANFEGIGLHHYGLPGYPASHSCVRFYEADAEWFYNWADQWILDESGQQKIASGTPVIIFGEYNFAKAAPWKRLSTEPTATKVTKDEAETLVQNNLTKIMEEKAKREQVLAAQGNS
jgi:lipoprotein-anchoring transpeptidase ErfK/SrfK